LKRIFVVVCFFLSVLNFPAGAQRRAVLPQVDEPHPYYYRELYLPQLTSGPSGLSWSPDSAELVYSMAGSLWLQKLDSNLAKQLTGGTGYDYQPDWSPDGKSVVYVSYQKDAMELWLLELGTGNSKQLTTGGAVNVEPRWSPDGKKIVWVSTQHNRRFHVFMADVSDGLLQNVKRLTGETKSTLPRYYYSAYDMEINPIWTRDGKEILFVSNRGHIHGTGGFWRMKAEPGAEAREIHYEETSWKARPDFSPDGSRMVFSSYLGRQWQNLWVMPAKGGDAFPISYGDWDQTNPRWSPDGKKIAAISNEKGLTEIAWQEIPGSIQNSVRVAERKYLHPRATLTISVNRGPSLSTNARISVTDESWRSYSPDRARVYADDGFDRAEQAFETHYFYAENGYGEIALCPGKYLVRISAGMEEMPVRRHVEIQAGQRQELSVNLEPVTLEARHAERWVASDLHVHMNYGGTYRNSKRDLVSLGEAEGLDIIDELVVNKEQRFPDVGFDDSGDPDALIVRGQEFHTSYWGHRGILRLRDQLLLPGYAGYPNTAAASLYPMNADVYDMAHAKGALVGAVHPFDAVPNPFAKPAERITDELPVDVALGKLDYMEIVGFSDHKSTAEVWYKLLNLGFKIPAGAGTDATTNYSAPIRGQVGFDRVYVWTPAWPTTLDVWMDELKKGRTFATNGPLLEFKLSGEMVGSELKLDAGKKAVPFTAKLRSIVPVDHLEVVCNGQVAQTLNLEGARETADATGTIPINESGWCVLRAWSDKAEYPVMDNYTYATTSPVYVILGGKRAYSKKDAEYFKAWIDRVVEITDEYPDWNSAREKAYVMKKLREARAVYQTLQ